MHAIITKFLKPTGRRHARIRVTYGDQSMMVSCKPWLNKQQNHDAAAQTLIQYQQIKGVWIGGETDDGVVYVESNGRRL